DVVGPARVGQLDHGFDQPGGRGHRVVALACVDRGEQGQVGPVARDLLAAGSQGLGRPGRRLYRTHAHVLRSVSTSPLDVCRATNLNEVPAAASERASDSSVIVTGPWPASPAGTVARAGGLSWC